MLFLTHSELAELTERKRKAEQIAWLKSNGFLFATGANGHARVSREHVQVRLCGGPVTSTAPAAPEPNWGAL